MHNVSRVDSTPIFSTLVVVMLRGLFYLACYRASDNL
jgi:hypothetical protein